VTVGKLKKLLEKMPDRVKVFVDRETLWTGNDVFTINPIEKAEYKWIHLGDGDGGIALRKDGTERGSWTCLLGGNS
jgi:hypothetical protein